MYNGICFIFLDLCLHRIDIPHILQRFLHLCNLFFERFKHFHYRRKIFQIVNRCFLTHFFSFFSWIWNYFKSNSYKYLQDLLYHKLLKFANFLQILVITASYFINNLVFFILIFRIFKCFIKITKLWDIPKIYIYF